ncbi:MAG: hypothetical protein ABIN68_06865 [Sphingomicrobium sp.]
MIGAQSAARPPRILFVCQFGSVKSAISRELLKRRAAQRHIPLIVVSRGITPEEHLSPAIKSRLLLEHIDPAAEPLRKLRQADLDAADRVIIFDKLPARLRAEALEDWTDLPSILNNYPKARADLDRRIDAVLASLVRRKAAGSRSP